MKLELKNATKHLEKLGLMSDKIDEELYELFHECATQETSEEHQVEDFRAGVEEIISRETEKKKRSLEIRVKIAEAKVNLECYDRATLLCNDDISMAIEGLDDVLKYIEKLEAER